MWPVEINIITGITTYGTLLEGTRLHYQQKTTTDLYKFKCMDFTVFNSFLLNIHFEHFDLKSLESDSLIWKVTVKQLTESIVEKNPHHWRSRNHFLFEGARPVPPRICSHSEVYLSLDSYASIEPRSRRWEASETHKVSWKWYRGLFKKNLSSSNFQNIVSCFGRMHL